MAGNGHLGQVGGMNTEQERGISDADYVRAFAQRNWWVFAVCLGGALVAAAVYLAIKRPSYEATAVMLLQPQAAGNETGSAPIATQELVRSQFALIQSEPVLGAVVTKLGLDRDPDFTAEAPDNAGRQAREAAAREELKDRLKIGNDGRSFTIDLTATARDPVLAARIANAAAAAYVEAQRQQKVQVLESTRGALGRQLDALRQATLAAEQNAETFRRRSGLLPLSSLPEDGESYENSTPSSREIVELARARAALEVDNATARGKLAAQQTAIGRGRGDSTAEVVSSSVIAQLRTNEAALAQRQAELLAKYSSDHPLVVPVRAQLAQTRRLLAAETGRIHASVASQASAGSTALKSSDERLRVLEAQRNRDLAASVQLRQLTRDAQLRRDTYEQFSAQTQRATERASLQLPDVPAISSATPPLRGSQQDRTIVLLAFVLAGLVAASAISLWRSLRAARRERVVVTEA
jgi:succinoglycan biosynthesis transport protein ExoP